MLVERVEAPPVIEQGGQVPLRVLVRSSQSQLVVGRLTLKQITEAEQPRPIGQPGKCRLRRGLNAFSFTRPLTDEQRSYTYEAEFQPERVEDEKGNRAARRACRGDRVQNNRASARTSSRAGQRRILLLENKAGEHQFLVDRLVGGRPGQVQGRRRAGGRARPATRTATNWPCFSATSTASSWPTSPADQVSEEQQEVIRSNTHDQGCGLVMIGGPESFGAGGWQNTPVEKALPVDCEIKSLQGARQGRPGAHHARLGDGRRQYVAKEDRQTRRRAAGARRRGRRDLLRLQPQVAHPLAADRRQQGGDPGDRSTRWMPGDMPDFDPALQMAHEP